MGFVPFGGFVFTVDGGNYVGSESSIKDDTFAKIAKILDIPKADIEQLIKNKPRSVYVYRGTPAAAAPFDSVVGKRGGGKKGGGGKGGGGKKGGGRSAS